MKPPKLIGDLGPAAAVGLSQVEALRNTGAPFLTSYTPGAITRLKNGFAEVEVLPVEVALSKPSLWAKFGTTTSATNLTGPGTTSPATEATGSPAGSSLFTTIDWANDTWVGDGRILVLRRLSSVYWPVLELPQEAREVVPGDALEAKRAVSFFASATPDTTGFCRIRLFASGLDGARRYRWGFSYAITGDSHRVFLGDTLNTVGTVVLPLLTSVAQRGNSGVFCIGEGKLISFVGALEGISMCTSDNHGDSWTAATLPSLNAWFTFTSGFYDGDQVRNSMAGLAAFYLGSGKTLVFVPGTGTSIPWEALNQFRCFLFDGSTCTHLPWPGSASGFFFSTQTQIVGGCFGPGCFIAWRFSVASGHQAVYTTDFGTTWSISAAAPAGSLFAFSSPVTMSKYVDPDHPGSILFAVRREDGTGTDIWKTTGLFDVFKKVGKVYGTAPLTNQVVPFLERRKVRPELGEF